MVYSGCLPERADSGRRLFLRFFRVAHLDLSKRLRNARYCHRVIAALALSDSLPYSSPRCLPAQLCLRGIRGSPVGVFATESRYERRTGRFRETR